MYLGLYFDLKCIQLYILIVSAVFKIQSIIGLFRTAQLQIRYASNYSLQIQLCIHYTQYNYQFLTLSLKLYFQ